MKRPFFVTSFSEGNSLSSLLVVTKTELDIFLFLDDSVILLNLILELQIPVTTDEVILPVPIKPNLI